MPWVARGSGTGLLRRGAAASRTACSSCSRGCGASSRSTSTTSASCVEPGVTNVDGLGRGRAAHFYPPDPSSARSSARSAATWPRTPAARTASSTASRRTTCCGLEVVLPDGDGRAARRQGARPARLRPARGVRRLRGHARRGDEDHRARGARARVGAHARRLLRVARATPGEAVSEIVSAGVIPGGDRDDGQPRHRRLRGDGPRRLARSTPAPRCSSSSTARRRECEARFDEVGALCEHGGCDEVRVARDEAERQLFWKTRKAAFPAMGRISPHYYVQDGVIPRTPLAEVLDRIDALAREYDMQVANVFHAGDGNLHPLVCYDGPEGEAAARRGARRADPRRLRRARRLDHRRARRRRRQEALHAQDVQRGRPRRRSRSCAAPSTPTASPTPARSCRRRGCAARSRGPTGEHPLEKAGPGGALLMDAARRARRRPARPGGGRAAAHRRARARRAAAARSSAGGTSRRPDAEPATAARRDRRAQRGRPDGDPAGRRAAATARRRLRGRGADARARPARRRRDDRRRLRHRRLGSAAPPLRRPARPRARRAGRAARRHRWPAQARRSSRTSPGTTWPSSFAGAFGTLGVIDGGQRAPAPAPREWLTVVVRRDDPRALAAAAQRADPPPARGRAPGLRWEGGRGAVLVRSAARRRRRARAERSTARSSRTTTSCGPPSARRQRGPVVLRVSTTQRASPRCCAPRATHGARASAAPRSASPGCAPGRPSAEAVTGAARRGWAPCVLLDAPAALRREVDPWGTPSAEPL